ncbi:MAG: hypothetical protein ABH874_05520 [Methanobacteriota archaeon]
MEERREVNVEGKDGAKENLICIASALAMGILTNILWPPILSIIFRLFIKYPSGDEIFLFLFFFPFVVTILLVYKLTGNGKKAALSALLACFIAFVVFILRGLGVLMPTSL